MTLSFAVATFGRVFDMTPAQDSLTLDELAQALTRFQLKAQLASKIRRELERFQRGEGPYAGASSANATLTPGDIEHRIRREAKTDLRIWTPCLFQPGQKRASESIVHISAVVYDIDEQLSLEAARDALRPWWHVGHSTWSHTPERPKFRVCIPFARPIRPADFLAVWDWGDEAIGKVADRTGRQVARGMALPAVPSVDAPRASWVHVAPLFDPVAEGLAEASPQAAPAPTRASFMRVDPDEVYVTATAELDTGDDDPWSGGAPIASTSPSPASSGRVASSSETATRPAAGPDLLERLLARVDSLEARLAALEKRLP